MTRRLDLAMLLLLTFSTGMVDAIGYLGFDKVFTGNMTGNVVILGMGLAGADGVPVLRPALALVFFMVGAALSGRILGNIGETWQRRTTLIFASVAVGCAGLSLYVGLMPNPEVGLAGTIFTSALSALMGAQAAAARRMKIADVTTVVVTSTIVGLASDSRLAGGDSTRWVRRVLAVALILTGALAGAATLMLNQWIGIAVVAVIIAVATVIGHYGGEETGPRRGRRNRPVTRLRGLIAPTCFLETTTERRGHCACTGVSALHRGFGSAEGAPAAAGPASPHSELLPHHEDRRHTQRSGQQHPVRRGLGIAGDADEPSGHQWGEPAEDRNTDVVAQ
jgi:uncharacterized membrane protein YoaK (UPF0700 family)